jgi:hypothetical protein
MAKRRKLIIGAVVLFLVFAFELIARFRGQRDFDALMRGELPPFARESAYLSDGGSVEYSGFGYTVIRMHRIWPRPGATNWSDHWYRVGPELRYWLPLPLIAPNRDGTIETNR